MFRKALTHLIILMLAVLPVQVISAGVENSNIHMGMGQSAQMDNKCVHAPNNEIEAEQVMTDKACCDDQSHQCQSCNNCPQAATSTMILPAQNIAKTSSSETQKYFVSHLLLNGTSLKSLLRPPRIIV